MPIDLKPEATDPATAPPAPVQRGSESGAPSRRRSATPASRGAVDWERLAVLYGRWALGAAFLSGIMSRFGLWGRGVGYGNFANFLRYTAEVNSFMPAFTIPFLGWAATVLEFAFGVLLIAGLWPRRVALGSAALLALFGLAMAASFGVKEPLDYSVFSASAAAALLAFHARAPSGSHQNDRDSEPRSIGRCP